MKSLIIALFCLTLSCTAKGQSKPTWVDGYHKDLANSYIDVFSGRGNAIADARKQAINNIVEERSRATGRRYSIEENNGIITMHSQDELTVKCRIVDEYHSRQYGNYEVYLLVQTARHPDYAYESINVTDRYPVSARILVPGFAQIYKGQTAKGLIMLGGVVGCSIGALVFENTRSDYKNKMKEQPEFAQTYNTKANNNETARNVCIGAAAAFYVWSLIDGIASKGKRRVFVGKNSSLAIHPVASSEGAVLALTYNF